MTQTVTPAALGEPHLKASGLKLWVLGYQFPEARDNYDGNWLRVTAHCATSGASVWAPGAILMVTDVAGFGDQCATMLAGDINSEVLDPLEPELKVSLDAADSLGHIRVQVEITPDHLAHAHRFNFEIDHSNLPGIIQPCSVSTPVSSWTVSPLWSGQAEGNGSRGRRQGRSCRRQSGRGGSPGLPRRARRRHLRGDQDVLDKRKLE